ncbi:MAG TPA: response regulator transcription factor [Sphingomicrobium sp.]|jgi:two-component system OmpR family response regulator
MRILIAEDDADTAKFVERGLGELGHNVIAVGNGMDALHLAISEEFDLLILDRMLPGIDGLSVVRRLRTAEVTAPVLLLTALGKIEDRVEGLDAGGDDYLIKPFAFSELAARVNALSRRPPPQATVTRLFATGIEMNLLSREVRRDGKIIPLQPREFQLLEELLRHVGEFVTRTMLLERVWDFHFDPQTKIVETHISRLRSKLNQGGLPDPIETVRGVGYRVRAK